MKIAVIGASGWIGGTVAREALSCGHEVTAITRDTSELEGLAAVLRSSSGAVRWTYISPPPTDFVPGEKTGSYRVRGGDVPVTDAEGNSRVTSGTWRPPSSTSSRSPASPGSDSPSPTEQQGWSGRGCGFATLARVEALRWTRQPRLDRPVMIAAFEGWNDAGDAASGATKYMAERWDAKPFAELDPEEFYDFTSARPDVAIDEGMSRRIEWPANVLSAAAVPGRGHDAVFLRGTEPHLRWRTFCGTIVEASRELGVELVISLGALLAEVPHSRPTRVTGTAADPELVERLGLQRSGYEGPTGIVGVLQDALGRSGIPSASMWATVPHYLAQTPSPKATLALVSRTAELLGTSVQTTDLEIASASYDRQVSEMIADDEEAAAYVARLEEADESEGMRLEPSSGDHIADEVERFLRDHHRD